MFVLAHLFAYGGLILLVAILFWAIGREQRIFGERLEAVAAERGWSLAKPNEEGDRWVLSCGSLQVTIQLGHSAKVWARPIDGGGYRAEQGGDAPVAQQDLGDGMYLSKEGDAFMVEDLRNKVSAERLVFMIDHLLERCDPKQRLADDPLRPARRTPEQRFTRGVLIILASTLALGILLTLVGGPVRALQSRALCDDGVSLTWVERKAAARTSSSLVCGQDGAEIACFSAVLLAMHALAFPLIGLAYVVTRRRAS